MTDGNKTRVVLSILGEKIAVWGTNPEYLEKLGRDVQKRLTEIGQKDARLTTQRLALLTCLEYADRLRRLELQNERLLKTIEKSKRSGTSSPTLNDFSS